METKKDLKGFAAYLRKDHLKDFVMEKVRIIKTMDIPLMKLFSNFTEQQIIEMSMISSEKFLISLEDNTALEKAKKNLELWEADNLPGMSRLSIQSTDLILMCALQKKALIHFLPGYTTDAKELIAIVQEVEDYYTKIKNDGMKVFIKIQKDLIEDVKAQKNVDENLRKSLKEISDYKYALDESSIVAITDQKGIIKYVNDKFCKISKYKREELIGQDHRIISSGFHPKEFIRDLWTTISSGKIWKGELCNKAKDGSNYWVDTTIIPFLNEEEKPYQYIAVRTDSTERKRIEKEFTEAKVFAELATDIAEEAKRKAESATQIAEDAVKSKQQFLSNMSHEIRTPMNAIIGFTKVVLKTDLSTKQKEYLSAIKISGDALIVLINDILDLAKVDAGKMTFEQTPFKMALSISAMLHLFETKIQEKNLKLVKEYDSKIPEVLVGDPVRLHQIILNLVSNAVKFTTKGKITVSVNLLSEDEEMVKIEFAVSDTGIGIAQDKLEHVFENFQ